MGCELIYECGCACGTLSGEITIGDEDNPHVFAASEDDVRGAGELQLTTEAAEVPDSGCACAYTGEGVIYPQIDDGNGGLKPDLESPVAVSVSVFVNAADCAYAEVECQGIKYTGLSVDEVDWKDATKCEGFDPSADAPSKVGGYPETQYYIILNREERPLDSGLILTLRGDTCCREACVGKQAVDEHGHPHVACVESPEPCPVLEKQDWPWDRPRTEERDPAEEFDSGTAKYDRYYVKGDPLLTEEQAMLESFCGDPDCCDVLAGAFEWDGSSHNRWAFPEEWWTVSGWQTSTPSSPPSGQEVYCFDWCGETYYKTADEGGLPDEDKPVMTFNPPSCGSGNGCFIYGYKSADETEFSISSLSGAAGDSVPDADYLIFKTTRTRFVVSDEDPSKYECDGDGNYLTEQYEAVCASNVTPVIPSPSIHGDCIQGGWFCVKKIPADPCPRNWPRLAVTISWSYGGENCRMFFNNRFRFANGETRYLCPDGYSHCFTAYCSIHKRPEARQNVYLGKTFHTNVGAKLTAKIASWTEHHDLDRWLARVFVTCAVKGWDGRKHVAWYGNKSGTFWSGCTNMSPCGRARVDKNPFTLSLDERHFTTTTVADPDHSGETITIGYAKGPGDWAAILTTGSC